MPDTGYKSPTSFKNSASVAFSDLWITSGGGIIVFLTTNGIQTVDDFSGTIDGTVTGAEILLSNTYVTSGTGRIDIQISIDNGSNFSSSITSANVGTDSAGDTIVGGSTQLWGLDWSGFSNLNQIEVKGLNPTANVFSDHVQIKIYYNSTRSTLDDSGKITLLAGTMTLKAGNLTIK